jgi:hypothetical protein
MPDPARQTDDPDAKRWRIPGFTVDASKRRVWLDDLEGRIARGLHPGEARKLAQALLLAALAAEQSRYRG